MAGLGAMRPDEAWQAGRGLVWSGMGGKAWQARQRRARLGPVWPGLAGAVGSARFG